MKILRVHALAAKVLVVAVKREIGWCAYCDAVVGQDHMAEFQAVMHHGVKLSEEIARAIFPQFSGMIYER